MLDRLVVALLVVTLFTIVPPSYVNLTYSLSLYVFPIHVLIRTVLWICKPSVLPVVDIFLLGPLSISCLNNTEFYVCSILCTLAVALISSANSTWSFITGAVLATALTAAATTVILTRIAVYLRRSRGSDDTRVASTLAAQAVPSADPTQSPTATSSADVWYGCVLWRGYRSLDDAVLALPSYVGFVRKYAAVPVFIVVAHVAGAPARAAVAAAVNVLAHPLAVTRLVAVAVSAQWLLIVYWLITLAVMVVSLALIIKSPAPPPAAPPPQHTHTSHSANHPIRRSPQQRGAATAAAPTASTALIAGAPPQPIALDVPTSRKLFHVIVTALFAPVAVLGAISQSWRVGSLVVVGARPAAPPTHPLGGLATAGALPPPSIIEFVAFASACITFAMVVVEAARILLRGTPLAAFAAAADAVVVPFMHGADATRTVAGLTRRHAAAVDPSDGECPLSRDREDLADPTDAVQAPPCNPWLQLGAAVTRMLPRTAAACVTGALASRAFFGGTLPRYARSHMWLLGGCCLPFWTMVAFRAASADPTGLHVGGPPLPAALRGGLGADVAPPSLVPTVFDHWRSALIPFVPVHAPRLDDADIPGGWGGAAHDGLRMAAHPAFPALLDLADRSPRLAVPAAVGMSSSAPAGAAAAAGAAAHTAHVTAVAAPLGRVYDALYLSSGVAGVAIADGLAAAVGRAVASPRLVSLLPTPLASALAWWSPNVLCALQHKSVAGSLAAVIGAGLFGSMVVVVTSLAVGTPPAILGHGEVLPAHLTAWAAGVVVALTEAVVCEGDNVAAAMAHMATVAVGAHVAGVWGWAR